VQSGGAWLSLGALMAFMVLSRSFNQPINQISMQFNSIIMAMAGAERIFALMDELPETLVEIQQAELTWIPMRAEKGADMVISPVWMHTYVSDDGEQEGYTGWAAFSAIDGTLVDAIFN
jgi:ATP-binding cassette subfamily B protein